MVYRIGGSYEEDKGFNKWDNPQKVYMGSCTGDEEVKLRHIITIDEIPPSNNKYMGRGSVYVQRVQYQEEKQRWEWLIRAAIRKKQEEPIKRAKIEITYYFPTRHRRDPDNYSGKFILDGLVRAGIIEDDSFNCIELELSGEYDKEEPRTEIGVYEYA